MFVHILCAVVLLSAFTAHGAIECADYPTLKDFCRDTMERTGRCKSNDTEWKEYAKVFCPKTCDLCEHWKCADDPSKPNFCWNMERYDKCNSTEKISKKARKYCPKTCGLC